MANANGNNQGLLNPSEEPKKPTPSQTVAAYIKKYESTIMQVLPKHMDPERLTRICLTTIRTNPKLLQCDIASLMASVVQCATLGLEPGLLGHAYILPYKSKDKGMQAQLIIGFKGMIDLARRSGNIQSISAHEVYENDLLELTYGLEERLVHIPWHLRDEKQDKPGDIRGAYMVAHFTDGGHYLHYMSKAEIDAHRARSKSANNGPWVSDYVEMAKKTVVRAGWKWLPISIEIAEKVEKADNSTPESVEQIADDEIILEPIMDEEETK